MRKYAGKPLSQMTLISYSARSMYSCGTDAPANRRSARPVITSCVSQDPWSCPSGTGKIGIRSLGAHTSV